MDHTELPEVDFDDRCITEKLFDETTRQEEWGEVDFEERARRRARGSADVLSTDPVAVPVRSMPPAPPAGAPGELPPDRIGTASAPRPGRHAEEVSSPRRPVERTSGQGGESQTAGEAPRLQNWPDFVRAIPNPMARSALFAGVARDGEVPLGRRLLQSRAGISVLTEGLPLRQAHLSVLLELLHLARGKTVEVAPDGTPCLLVQFERTALLKSMGRTKVGGSDRADLDKTIERLAETLVTLRARRDFFSSEPLITYRRPGGTERMVGLNQGFIDLFAAGYTRIDHGHRLRLQASPLAQWAHAYIASDVQTFDLLVRTYWCHSGSASKSAKDFKPVLKVALGRLEEVGFLHSARVNSKDWVSVRRQHDQHVRVPEQTAAKTPEASSQ